MIVRYSIMEKKKNIKIIAKNHKARHRFAIIDTFEAGIELKGTEVKSIRNGKVQISDAYASVNERGELIVFNLHIAPYEHGTVWNHNPDRPRRLLMHKREILRLKTRIEQQGYTLPVLQVYFKKQFAKIAIGLGKGKKMTDRRQEIAQRIADRQMARARKRY